MQRKKVQTPTERSRMFKERMYSAGYKQMQIWVPRELEGKAEKGTRLIFLRRIEALTAGWSKTKLSRLFSDVLKIIKERIEEDR